MRLNKSFNSAFTLTEILIAVGVVGVIAALVLPGIVVQYQNSAQNYMFERLEQTLEDSLRKLVVDENKVSFSETSMYSSTTPDNYDNSSGKFIQNFLSVAKYFGDATTHANEIKDEAFAEKYYSFTDGDKNSTEGVSRREFSPNIMGACAILKNGVSICLKPQIGGVGAEGIVDLNGKKGPNIEGRDYRTITLLTVTSRNFSDNGNKSTEDIAIVDHENIQAPPDNPCADNPYSNECCLYSADNGGVDGPEHPCCASDVASQIPACSNEIELSLYTPSASCKLPNCDPQITTSSYAYDGNRKQLTTLNTVPPQVYLYCDGRRVGYIPGSTIKSVIERKMSQAYFTITMSYISQLFYKPNCGTTSGKGLSNNKGSMVFTTGGVYKDYEYDGVKWTVTYR